MGWQPEPDKLDIVWDSPSPVKVKTPRGWKWERLLRPVQVAPGCEARVATHSSRNSADAIIRRIKRRLEEVDPYGNWEYRTGQIQDDSGSFGVWVTYHGQISEGQYQEKLLKRRELSAAVKAGKAKAAVRKSLLTPDKIIDLTHHSKRRR